MLSKRLGKWRTEFMQAVDVASEPLALMRDNILIYANSSFFETYGDCLNYSLDDFFLPAHVEQLNWLIAGTRGEADKIILPLKETLDTPLAGKSILTQIWPIDKKFYLLSFRENYSSNRIADLDELTRLPNRRKAQMLLEIERARVRGAKNFCLTLGDIDHFKQVNDVYGHDVGDQVLKHVTEIMTSALREGDWVARWGGEEFLIFTDDSDIVTGMQPIERIRQKLEETPFISEVEIPITMSFGLAHSAGHKTEQALINKADVLLYEAKNNGRNRIEWENSGEIVWIAANIRKLISDNGLAVGYIPVYDWEDQLLARQITIRLPNNNFVQVEKMISSAKRLNQLGQVDHCFMQILANEFKAVENELSFFPLREQLFKEYEKELFTFLQEFPQLCLAIDASTPLSEELVEKIIILNRPLALFNFNPLRAPSYLLGLPNLQHIIFSKVQDSKDVLKLLHGKINCYAQCLTQISAADRVWLQQQGFDGWTMSPAMVDEESSK
ncbi:MAG: GGDEF domain-containing protein [Proteobacteria bacterium]|nr:GGDEF domain-containing protein [Pseudomonadota bacterium]